MNYGWGEATDEPAREDARPTLFLFERANNFVFTPRREQIKNEFRRMALWKGRAGRANGSRFTSHQQFTERPTAAGCGVAQCGLTAPFRRNFAPALVKHCQFVNAALTSFQARFA
jgi:hypothetical protein